MHRRYRACATHEMMRIYDYIAAASDGLLSSRRLCFYLFGIPVESWIDLSGGSAGRVERGEMAVQM